MDARMVGGGHGGLQATRYAIKYATKQQTVLDNASVVELAFRRRIEREAAMSINRTELERGLARFMSLVYSSSSAMEVGGPLVTATLLENGAAMFSCEFERLVVVEVLSLMDNEDVNTLVVERDDKLFTGTSIRRYTTRPRCLESCCWYDYCAWYKQTRIRKPLPVDGCTLVSDDLHELANHVREHGLARVHYPQVPEIVGPRMPDARCIDDPELNEKAELYYRLATVLYCPFRCPQQFLDSRRSAKHYFLQWRPFDQPKLHRSLEFHQQYCLAFDEASDFHAQQAAEDADEECHDQDVLRGHVGDGESLLGPLTPSSQ